MKCFMFFIKHFIEFMNCLRFESLEKFQFVSKSLGKFQLTVMHLKAFESRLKVFFEAWIEFVSHLNQVWVTFGSCFNHKSVWKKSELTEKTVECQQTKSAFIHIGCWCNRNLICKLFPSQFPSKTCVGNFSVAESYSLQRRRQRERSSSDRNMIQRENNLLALEYCTP